MSQQATAQRSSFASLQQQQQLARDDYGLGLRRARAPAVVHNLVDTNLSGMLPCCRFEKKYPLQKESL